jgi:type IV pilus assembly protein PilN
MIRVNLLAVKRKKKAKPLPTFIVSATLLTVLAICVLAYLVFYFNTKLQSTKSRFEKNKITIEELKAKIKAVENYDKLNKTLGERTKIIEQLRRNQNIPVMMLDELNKGLPNGVWLTAMTASGSGGTVDGYAFTNADVVSYVESLKSSKLLTEIYLQESKQAEIEKIPLYQFKVTFKVAS